VTIRRPGALAGSGERQQHPPAWVKFCPATLLPESVTLWLGGVKLHPDLLAVTV